VPKNQRHNLHQLKENLQNTPGVNNVEVNHNTGSVLVHHDHEMPIFEVLHKAVETVGTDLLTTLIEGETAELLGPATIVATGVGLIASMGKSFIGRRTPPEGAEKPASFFSGTPNDVKTLLPAAFLLAAAYKAWETESFWTGVSPLALAYWAFDTYWKLNISSDLSRVEAQNLGGGNGHHPGPVAGPGQT
jgi:hypothetical protein